jgi:hypothetical protein
VSKHELDGPGVAPPPADRSGSFGAVQCIPSSLGFAFNASHHRSLCRQGLASLNRSLDRSKCGQYESGRRRRRLGHSDGEFASDAIPSISN